MPHSPFGQTQFRSLLLTTTKNRKKLIAALGLLVLSIVVFRVSVITVRSHGAPVGPVSGPTVAVADELARDVAIFNQLFPTLAVRETESQGMYKLLHHRWAASPLAPVVTASKTDALFTDVDGDLQADPGDTLKYTVTINASGEDATGVTFTDTVDPNTAFVAGSLTATPVAVNDSYQAIGNVRIQVPAGSGVLTNDFLGLPAATITGAPVTSANGGDVTLNADGSFSYNPPAGFEGSDSFTYTLTNSEGSNNATVSITVSGMIWFINNTASCPCDGRLTNPFNSLSSFNAVNIGGGNNPDENDNIFVYESATDYVGPVTLLDNQRFIGQDAAATLSAITGLTPPAHSDPLPATNSGNGVIVNITSAAAGINVASGNTLRGFTGGNAAPDINGSSFGTLTISDVTLNGTGQALNLSTGTLAATFGSISSTNSAATGISLTSASGSLTSGATTITNPTGKGIEVMNSGANLDLANTAVTGSGDTGISLSNNGGNFIFGDLDIAPDAGQRAFHATSNTGTISSTSGSISGSGATAVEIVGPSPAMRTLLDMTLTSVSANGGVNGIKLENTTTNPSGFTVTGDGSLARNGSGGTITAVTDDGIALTNADNVTLQSMNLTNNGDTAPTLADAQSTAGDQTVQISGGSNVILSGVLIQNPTGSGIVVLNLGGTNRVNSDSRITQLAAGQRHGIYVNNTNTNMTLFEFKNSQMIDFASSPSAFFFANTGTSNMTLDVKGSTFEDLAVQAITAAGGGVAATTGTLTSIIGGPLAADRNFFQNAKGTGENNVALLVNNGAFHVGTIENNLFDNIAESGLVANTSIIRTQNNGGKLTAVVEDNTVQNIAYASGGRHVIGHIFEPLAFNAANFSDLRFEGNTVTNVTYTGTNREFVHIDYRTTASGGDIKILNNNFTMNSADAQELLELRFRPTNASTIDLLVDGNTGTGNTTSRFLDIDSEASATVNATVTNNNFTNNNATPGQSIDVATEAAASSLCANISGNALAPAAANTINLNEIAGNMTVTQASAAAVSAANGGATVSVGGTPTFGAPACSLPMNATNLRESRKSQNSYARIATPVNTLGPGTRRAPGLKHPAIASSQSGANLSSVRSEATASSRALKPRRMKERGDRHQTLASLRDRRSDRDKPFQHHASASVRPTAYATLADVMLSIGTLPAGESVTITFRATVDDPFTGAMAQVSNQGTVSGTNFADVLTDDPDVGNAADPTVTPIDLPEVSVAVSPASVAEDGGTNLQFTFTREAPTTNALTVNFSIGGSATFGASPNDYTQTGAATFSPPNGTVTFAAGSATAIVTVDPEADTTVEPDETVVFTVTSGAGYAVGTPSSAIGTITNDDTDVSVAVSPLSVAEDGATNLVYTFTRTGVTTGALTVNFSIGGTATFGPSPDDYTQMGATTFTPPTGTVTFTAGSSTAQVTVDPEADTTVEPDETVILTVTAGTGYNVGSPSSATGTITNDDADVSIAVSPASVAEDGATNLVFTFTRTGFTGGALVVNFTIGGTATFGPSPDDYTQTGATTFTPPTGTVTFGAGNSTAQITVDPETDAVAEPDETVTLTLAAGTGYNVVSPSSATGTILNDDTVVTVAVSPASQPEGGGDLVYTFTRTGSTTSSLTVNFSVGGTASFPADYSQSGAATFTPPTATVTIGVGNSSANVNVTPLTDCFTEGNETVEFTVQPGTGYGVGSPSTATGTIVDVPDATAPVITLDPNRPMNLWPPNHAYHSFTVSQFVLSATDNCDPNVDASDVYITKITSDEVEDGAADGSTLNDMTISSDCKSFQLRAERSGNGDGRVYTIHFKVVDSNGNVGTATATVTVRTSVNTPAVDSGPVYTVMSICP